MDCCFNKEIIRSKFKEVKKQLSNDEKNFLDKKIEEKIFNLTQYLDSEIVLAYMASKIEINLDNIILESINKNKKVAIPRCDDSGVNEYEMDFYFINKIDDVVINQYKIREPKKLENKFFYEDLKDKNIIMFLPGLAFDKQGYRVGYGRGYYDRYLNKNCFKGLKIGLCYELSLIEKIDYQDNDVPVNILITEKQIYRLK